MDIEKAISEVTNFLKEDSPESVKELLETTKREFDTMQVSLKAANQESKGRKENIRKLQDELDETLAQVKKLSDDTKVKEMQADYETKLGELKTQNESLQKARAELHKIFRSDFVNQFSKVSEHPNFEKVKDKIKIPEKKEDKFDFDTLTDEDVIANIEKLKEYDSLGLFETEQEKHTRVNPNVSPHHEPDGEVDIVKLAKTDPERARQWLDKKRRSTQLFG